MAVATRRAAVHVAQKAAAAISCWRVRGVRFT